MPYRARDLLDLAVRALPPGIELPAFARQRPEFQGRLELKRGLHMGPREIMQFGELLEEEAGIVLDPRALDALRHPSATLDTAARLVREAWDAQDRSRAPDRPQRLEIVEVTITRTVIHA